LKISTMALRKHLTDLGVVIKSHMSLIDVEVADKIRMKYNEQMDIEKKAEKERKRLHEMRQAAKTARAEEELEAKAKAEEEIKASEPETAKPEPKAKATAKKRAEAAGKETVAEPVVEPAVEEVPPAEPSAPEPVKKVRPPNRIIVPYTQATPVVKRGPREPSRGKPGQETQRASGSARPDTRRRPEDTRKRQGAPELPPKIEPISLEVGRETEGKKIR